MAVSAGCGDDDEVGGPVRVVATTTQLADIAREVGGERVDVHGILEPGADPHGFEPRPSDALELADADVVLSSGGDVDGWLGELIESSGTDGEILTALDAVSAPAGGPTDEVDPHWWQDPLRGVEATRAIAAALIDADPGGREVYERNAARYTARLRELHAEVERCLTRVPADTRKLVTTHDSLGYFAERYGLELIGSVIPSLSTRAQPSAKDIDSLVDQMRREEVRAVFGEQSVNQRLERAVSREAGAVVGRPLFTDSLGAEGSPGDTYIESIRENADRLAEGMSGGAVSCF